jgi:hypothetical protein
MFILPFSLAVITSMTSCGGSKNKSAPPPTAQGIFLDAVVEGLAYRSGGQSGKTDPNGVFTYETGKDIRFSLGGIALGSALGQSLITPIELVTEATDANHPAVINRLRLLQTIDDDANPSNGIQITELMHREAEDETLEFNQSTEAFEADADVVLVVALISSTGPRMLIDTQTAISHFETALANAHRLPDGDPGGAVAGN